MHFYQQINSCHNCNENLPDLYASKDTHILKEDDTWYNSKRSIVKEYIYIYIGRQIWKRFQWVSYLSGWNNWSGGIEQIKMLNAQHVKRQVSKVKQVNHGRDVKIPDAHVLPVKRRRFSVEKTRFLSLVVSRVRRLTKWSAGQTLDREGPVANKRKVLDDLTIYIASARWSVDEKSILLFHSPALSVMRSRNPDLDVLILIRSESSLFI